MDYGYAHSPLDQNSEDEGHNREPAFLRTIQNDIWYSNKRATFIKEILKEVQAKPKIVSILSQ